ncbi:MAG: hypothetical protein JG782_1443 [Anaerophaga sp.]|nr:hypothetical protein [Anaerophaga sp.]MDI3520454.1 hypothetical protein [Anaerophaga sp.]MDN5290960.1 hypothetical protein [Anaerophaga sp.]
MLACGFHSTNDLDKFYTDEMYGFVASRPVTSREPDVAPWQNICGNPVFKYSAHVKRLFCFEPFQG